MKLSKLRNKKILILGFGREGQDTFKFLKDLFPRKQIDVTDKKLDKNYLKKLGGYDVIIKTPGIPFKILPKSSLDKITTQTEIFFDNCPGTIIGVTGTKGKSTTSSMIYQTLKKGKVDVQLIGNIGQPVLSFLQKAGPKSVFVYELSAHQLFHIRKSPHIAVLLNVYPEHLDYYRDFNEYAQAKANIAKFQSKNDYLIYNSLDEAVKKIAKTSKAQKIPIKGKYYQLDMAAAKAVAEIFGVPELKKFKFLPHRLEYVGKFKGIEFYNDSLATIPEAAIEAMDFLGKRVQTLILGGFDRGLNFEKLARRIKKSQVRNLILFPTTGQRIWQEVKKTKPSLIEQYFVKDMATAVKLAYQHTHRGKICLMSPASPSFGLFKDYAERGEMFKKFAKKYK